MTLDNKKRITYIGLLILACVLAVIGFKILIHSSYLANMIALLIFAIIGFSIVVGFFLVYLDRIVEWIWREKREVYCMHNGKFDIRVLKNAINCDTTENTYVKKKVAVRCLSRADGNRMMSEYIDKIALRGLTISNVNTKYVSFETDDVTVFFEPIMETRGLRFDEVFGFDPATAIYLRANHSQDDYDGDLVDYIVYQHKLRKGE